MSEVRIKQPPKETTVFETKIEKLRQFVLVGRFFCYLGVLVIVLVIVGTALKSPLIQVKTAEMGSVVVATSALYVVTLVLDFLADLGLIVLSMKKESQYVSKVVQQVQERQR